MRFAKYVAKRILVWLLTIWVGVTVVFIIQRMMPSDPVENMVQKLVGMSHDMSPDQIEAMRHSIRKQYGLEGSLFSQYISTLSRVARFDFGPSMSKYPMPVSSLIGQALPYTLTLLFTTTILSWIIGNLIGLLAGYKKDKWYSKVLETVSMCIYPTPYFIVALIILTLMAFVNRWFPLVPSFGRFEFSFTWFKNALRNAFMPALSLMLVGTGWWIISMKSLSSGVAEEPYTNYARLKGLRGRTIAFRYVFRNSILTQVTALALNLGGAFGGSLMCEIIFSYPGVGLLVNSAIYNADYNLLTGAIFISIFAVATATLVVDLIYPLLDPRIRYS